MPTRDSTNTIVHHRKGKLQTTIVQKHGSELRLLLLSPDSPEWQARVDLANPAKLLCAYMEAMMLALLWTPEPLRMHVMGLGAGQLPMVLRSHFPESLIDCTELDPDVYELARKFFSFRPDAHLRVYVEDGRSFLERRPKTEPYDLIFLDAFVGIGAVPLRLSTQEFFRVCRNQLSRNGTLVVNVLPKGGLVIERLATLASVFRNVYAYERDATLVLFANDDEASGDTDLVKIACELQERHGFSFPYPSLAAHLRRLEVPQSAVRGTQVTRLLTDDTPPQIIDIPRGLCRSIGRNDACPCGSGLKFKKCHGSATASNAA
jgi:protein-L-isoaspartate O-methyltransferase